MAVAVSGVQFWWTGGEMLITCVGGPSVMEINRDGTGFVLATGGDVVDGVLLADRSATAHLKACYVRFTGSGVVSYG